MGLVDRVKNLINDLRLSASPTILVVAHGWTLQAVRVLKGEISQDDAAQNIGMPGNCDTVEFVAAPPQVTYPDVSGDVWVR